MFESFLFLSLRMNRFVLNCPNGTPGTLSVSQPPIICGNTSTTNGRGGVTCKERDDTCDLLNLNHSHLNALVEESVTFLRDPLCHGYPYVCPHARRHHSIATYLLVGIESSSVLGQTDKTVLACRISCAFPAVSTTHSRAPWTSKSLPALNPLVEAMEPMLMTEPSIF